MLPSGGDIEKEREKEQESHYRVRIQVDDTECGVEGHAGGTGMDTNTRVEKFAV